MKFGPHLGMRHVPRWDRLAAAGAVAIIAVCLALGMIARAGEFAPQTSQTPSAAEIKAAFIFNFAKFTEWPPQSFASPGDPIKVAFWGAEDVRSAFQSLYAGKEINGRKVETRKLKSAEDLMACEVLFISAANGALSTGARKPALDASTLVIGESEDFLARGGMIRLFVDGNRMRFDVNLAAVNRGKVRLSSKLLALARSVVELPDQAGK